MNDLTTMPATELAQLYRDGAASPVEATRAALDAIDRHQDAVNAFVLVDTDGALADARASESVGKQAIRAGRPMASRPRSRTSFSPPAGPRCAAAC